MNKPTVLIIAPTKNLEEKLRLHFNVVNIWDNPNKDTILSEIGHTIDAVITRGQVGARNEMLDKLTNLKVIAFTGITDKNFDRTYLSKRNIVLSNTPDTETNDVADMAISLTTALLRGTVANDQFVRTGNWEKPWIHTGIKANTRITGKRVGIFGCGKIGSAIARRMSGFDCEIFYHNRNYRPDLPYTYVPSLGQLATLSQIMFVTCSGNPKKIPENKGLVDKSIMQMLGPKGFLINVSRGYIVKEQDLADCLKDGSLGGAGLDVFENEPHVVKDLLKLPNVVLSPIQASNTYECKSEQEDLALENLISFFNTGELITPI